MGYRTADQKQSGSIFTIGENRRKYEAAFASIGMSNKLLVREARGYEKSARDPPRRGFVKSTKESWQRKTKKDCRSDCVRCILSHRSQFPLSLHHVKNCSLFASRRTRI